MAEFLAPNDHNVQMEMGDLLLKEARPGDAAKHHRNALRLWPSLGPKIYPAYWKLGWTPAVVADRVLTDNPDLLRIYWADCLGRFNSKMTSQVWEGINRSHRDVFDAESYSKYFDYLIANKEYAEAKGLWKAIVSRFYDDQPEMARQRSELFWNGDFRFLDVFEGGLEWRISKNLPKASHAAVSTWRGLGQNNSLWLHFTGEANVTFFHVRHFLFVEPGKTYRLRYHVNALNITTDEGPYVKITVKTDPAVITKGQVIRNSGDWQLEDEFYVPSSAQWAEVAICRDSSSKLGNRIKGDVWFDDFVLEVIDASPKQTEARK